MFQPNEFHHPRHREMAWLPVLDPNPVLRPASLMGAVLALCDLLP